MPQYPAECDVYMPTSACPFRAAAERRIAEQRRAFAALRVFGLLKPGVPLSEAAAAVATVAERFQPRHPDVYRAGQGFQATAVDLLGELTAQRAADAAGAARRDAAGAAAWPAPTSPT